MTDASTKAKRAYKLQKDETVPDGVRRVAIGRLDHALEELRGKAGSSSEEAVHEARKDMKKLRALLRLVRGELGDDTYQRENETFRDVGRLLSDVRDADVLMATLDALLKHQPASVSEEAGAGLRRALANTGEGSHERSLVAAQAVHRLEGAWDRVVDWPLERDGFGALEDGLRTTYRRGHKAFERARSEPSADNMHEWRKRSKDLWYHHTLLANSWPEIVAPLGEQAHVLSDHLGDDHDLTVLETWVKDHTAEAGGLYSVQSFSEAIDARRGELQAHAFELGARLYAERPRAFTRRFEGWWRAWREAPTPASS
jgi:CHAD domain-containing protein